MAKDTKQRIFHAAAKLFADKGYSAVSIHEIADAADIKKSSLYNHYSSKESLLEAHLDYYMERMDRFFMHAYQMASNLTTGEDLATLLAQLLFYYEPEETQLMYYLTRIVHHEQFTSEKAAEILIGSGYRRNMETLVYFFDCVSEAGYIKGKERNRTYGEMFARISMTFAIQFLHPEIKHTIETQTELYHALIAMIVQYEEYLNLVG